MVDKLFFIVLVLNVTGLFRFIAPQLGVTIGHVTLALLVINVLYLVFKAQYTSLIFLRPGMGRWFFILVVWPLLTILYAPAIDIREIGLNLYFFTLFACAVVYTMSNGLQAIHHVMAVSLLITIFGLGLSMIRPQYFEAVAALASTRSEEMGRPVGFFMQPNLLAVSTGFLFIGWFSQWKHKDTILEVPVILAFLFVMLLTGSRSGMAVGILIVGIILSYAWWQRIRNVRYLLRLALLLGCVVIGIFGARLYLAAKGETTVYGAGELLDRMETLLSFKVSGEEGVSEDISVRQRFEAQSIYLPLIKEKPLLGHGFGTETFYFNKGIFYKTAHNEMLTCMLQYGVLFPFVFIFLFVSFYLNSKRRKVESFFETNSIGQFCLIVILLFSSIGGLLDNRTFFVILGMFFASIYYEDRFLQFDNDASSISDSHANN